MASIIGAKNGLVPKSRPRSRNVEEIKISAGWVEDQNNHYLLVDLPGFKKEEVKIETDRVDEVTVSGERQERENKFLYFERKFKVPENSDIGNTSGMLEDGILTVTVPKRVVPTMKEEPKIPEKEKEPKKEIQESLAQRKEEGPREDKQEQREFCKESKDMLEKQGADGSLFNMLKHKGIILTAIIAFSLGVLVSRKIDIGSRKIIAHKP
ncbi:hypothetical protein MLD38_012529 [Melastoma candidum]|uniref:Uncharacterized protein n=1 Tax=Melastoma candidum TaxID=119954 RepID=A0ACB9R676_9MYRT|nr:hypothetical protein MLD38_012529 [Melastoma candidum]